MEDRGRVGGRLGVRCLIDDISDVGENNSLESRTEADKNCRSCTMRTVLLFLSKAQTIDIICVFCVLVPLVSFDRSLPAPEQNYF